MKKNILTLTFLIGLTIGSMAQSFDSDVDVISFMEGKSFYNEERDLSITYEYLSAYNTYGITIINGSGGKSYFINVEITAYGSSADLYGMGVADGGNFGFRLYSNRLIVGKGEQGEVVFYKN